MIGTMDPAYTDLLRPHLRAGVDLGEESEVALRGFYQAARTGALGVEVSAERFLPFVAERLEPPLTLAEGLRQLRGADLLVCCGALAGEAAALKRIDEALQNRAAQALRRAGVDASATDEVLQRLRVRLLVRRPDATQRLSQYRGRGDLGRFLAVSALRELQMWRRAERKERSLGESLVEAEVVAAELSGLKAMYRPLFRDALLRGLERIDRRDRALLSMQVAHRLSAEQIAALYGVHRVTVARWQGRARRALIEAVRSELKSTLHAGTETLDSALELLDSQLDASLLRILQEEPGEVPR